MLSRGEPKLIKWDEKFVKLAEDLTKAGFSEQSQAEIMEVSLSTYNNWKKTHEEFKDAIYRGSVRTLVTVAESLYLLAVGYPYEEQVAVWDRKNCVWQKTTINKVKHPDGWAAARWMSLKGREQGWSETQRISIDTTSNININIDTVTTDILTFVENKMKDMKNITDIDIEPTLSIEENAGDDD